MHLLPTGRLTAEGESAVARPHLSSEAFRVRSPATPSPQFGHIEDMYLMVNTGQKSNDFTTLMPLPSGHTVRLPDGDREAPVPATTRPTAAGGAGA